jgi:hypothetical protein
MAYAFAGSNPALPTDEFGFAILDFGLGESERTRRQQKHKGWIRNPKSKIEYPKWVRGCSSMVEQQPSKLMTRVRFPSPASKLSAVSHQLSARKTNEEKPERRLRGETEERSASG